MYMTTCIARMRGSLLCIVYEIRIKLTTPQGLLIERQESFKFERKVIALLLVAEILAPCIGWATSRSNVKIVNVRQTVCTSCDARNAHEIIIPFPRYSRAFKLKADCSDVYNIGSRDCAVPISYAHGT